MEGYLGLAGCFKAQLNWHLGLKTLDAALNVEPRNATALLEKAICYLEIRRPDESRETLDICIEIGPNAMARRRRAESHIRLNNYVEAIGDLDACLELTPDDSMAFLERGWLYLELGELDYAYEDFREAVELSSREGGDQSVRSLGSKYVNIMKARSEFQAGRFKSCEDKVEKVGLLQDKSKISTWDEEYWSSMEGVLLEAPIVFLLRGLAAFCQGDHPIAMKYLQRASTAPEPDAYQRAAPCVVPAASEPSHGEAAEILRCVAKAFVMSNSFQFHTARSLLSKAIEKVPKSGPIRVLRAVVSVNLIEVNRELVSKGGLILLKEAKKEPRPPMSGRPFPGMDQARPTTSGGAAVQLRGKGGGGASRPSTVSTSGGRSMGRLATVEEIESHVVEGGGEELVSGVELLSQAEWDLSLALDLEANPSDEGWIYYMRGLVRREMGKSAEAMSDLEHVLSLEVPAQLDENGAEVFDVGLTVEAGLAYAHLLISEARIMEAVSCLEEILESDTEHPDVKVQLARCKAATGEDSSPLELMAEAVKSRKEDALTLTLTLILIGGRQI